MERIFIEELKDHIDEEISLFGWVDVRRDHGKLIFIDLRDTTGKVQMVALPDHEEAHKIADTMRPEWVIKVTGKVNKRPERMVKEGLNGELEIEITALEVLNEAETPPFEVSADTSEVDEKVRLKHRYLDLRTERLQNNLKNRDKIVTFFRKYMHDNKFIEVETPIMIKGTPEGAREYLVPSRVHQGKFYALPQSPQQFKQLLMVGGFDRYFQIARCFRDEDLRGDRQPEFTQLDYEMSFVTQEDVLKFTEAMFISMVEELYPDKKISAKPFPRMTYAESMEKYGDDRPDLRENKDDPNELAFTWVVDFPMFENNEEGELHATHHPFCSIHPDDEEKFMKGEDIFNIRANSYDLVLNGFELSSGSIRIHKRAIQEQVFNLLGISPEEQEKKFGHILKAFTYGAPPHGGFAPGIDRIVMLMQNEPNIREVIAFPKSREGIDFMMDSPSETSQKQLDELGIQFKKK